MVVMINELFLYSDLSDDKLCSIIESNQFDDQLFYLADCVRKKYYGTDVYLRGLIEFTNYCKNSCYYCGIRKPNTDLVRYRLTKQEILSCCHDGYSLGYRTFVLQGGEDPFFTDDLLCDIIKSIHKEFPDCAITLSVGEKSYKSYQAFFDAGARRFLLRHESAEPIHYRQLHPESMSLQNRKECLFNLKKIGYQVGSGFMIGSPYQSISNIISDLRFLQELAPDMIGVGPFIAQSDTPFGSFPNGSLALCLRIIAVIRLMFPRALIPATTAMGTIHPRGRELALKAGANVLMPNLSPKRVRKHYKIYDNKICCDEGASECRSCLNRRVSSVGYRIVRSIGDVKK